MKDIPGYEGRYAITEDGKVWSHPKQRSSKNGKWMKLQLFRNKNRRNKPRDNYTVGLYKDRARKSHLVHRLVALAYIPNPENKPQINHKDGNPLNNHVDNLEWCDNQENLQHAVKSGLFDINSGNQCETRSKNGKETGAMNGARALRKFTMMEAWNIKKICELSEKSILKIAEAYGVSWHTINKIHKSKSYQFEVIP